MFVPSHRTPVNKDTICNGCLRRNGYGPGDPLDPLLYALLLREPAELGRCLNRGVSDRSTTGKPTSL